MSERISRRAIVGAMPAVAAAAIVPTVAVASTDEIDRLIEAHLVAHRAFIEAIRSEEALQQAYRQAYPQKVEVPSLLGGTLGQIYGNDDDEEGRFKELVAKVFAGHRKTVARLSRIAPDLAERVGATIDSAEADDMALVERLFAEENARREAFGLAEANRDWQATCDAEIAAQTAICAYPCRTSAEGNRKADYLQTGPGISDELQDEQLDALIESLRG